VEPGAVLAVVHAASEEAARHAEDRLRRAFPLSAEEVAAPAEVHETL
jgi:hypothetical protein